MPRIAAVLVAIASLYAIGCEKHATVLPTDPGSGPGAPAIVITITTDRGSVEAGSSQPATLTITAKAQDGSPAADGTEVTVNTSLGNFGVDSTGKPLTLTTSRLSRGSTSVPFYAGAQTGTANVLAQIGTSVGRLNITIMPAPAAPFADFTFEAAGLSVLFTETSMGAPTSWEWDFGDGTQSTDKNPKHDYATAGTYTVKLTVRNGGGTSSKSKFVTLTPALLASFRSEVSGLTVLFTDTSSGTPTSWEWDFGDGSATDRRQHPRYVYASAGTYTVRLTVRNTSGATASASAFVSVGGNAPQADFKFEVAGLRVNFTDASTGSPTSWRWSFGDSKPEETVQNPTHAYDAAGTYNVTLTVSNLGGTTSKSQFVTVSLGDRPAAAFKFEVSGLQVVFTDQSTGSPTSWDWDFGDGSAHDTSQNTSHVYASAGTFKVTLKAANAAGDSSISQFVTVASAPAADFVYSVSPTNTLSATFVDQSSGSPTGWAWNFGDCGSTAACTSTQQNPTHVFPSPGTYNVSLTASNSAGQNTKRKDVTVGAPRASFTVTPASSPPRTYTFTDTTTPSSTARSWNFGDCPNPPTLACTSADATVTHTYTAAGTYTVMLAVGNAGGQDSTTRTVVVP